MTLISNTLDASVCGACPVPPEPLPVPTLPEWAVIMFMALLALAGFVALRKRPA